MTQTKLGLGLGLGLGEKSNVGANEERFQDKQNGKLIGGRQIHLTNDDEL